MNGCCIQQTNAASRNYAGSQPVRADRLIERGDGRIAVGRRNIGLRNPAGQLASCKIVDIQHIRPVRIGKENLGVVLTQKDNWIVQHELCCCNGKRTLLGERGSVEHVDIKSVVRDERVAIGSDRKSC